MGDRPLLGGWSRLKTILIPLMLALAAVAIPSTQAAPEPVCSVNSSNDTVCHAEAAGCEADAYMYDMEDALNHYSADCQCVHYDNYGRPALRTDCQAPDVPCQAGPTAPGGDTHCEAALAGCEVLVHAYDVEDAINRYRVDCGCVAYDNWGGGLGGDCIRLSAEVADPAAPCTTGIAQTWCDASVGPCDVRVTPWTAWGDVYAWADCRGGSMTRCYAEVHTQDPLNPEQWCAF